MKREGHDGVSFFTGTEVEHTPVFGHRTLFVVGVHDTAQIAWQIGEYNRQHRDPITHIYFGANMSFPNPALDDTKTWAEWESMILNFLDQGYWCTLDLDVKSTEGLLEGQLCEKPQFVPMISVKLPYVQQLGYNATIKLDDRDFRATNAGVWCHSVHDLMDRNKFTSWDKYTKDEVKK